MHAPQYSGSQKLIAYLVLVIAHIVGGVSLALLGLFFVAGPFEVVDLGLSVPAALALDAALCLVFCVQHSVMIRRAVQHRMGAWIPTEFLGTTFAIASAVCLLAMMVLWQAVPVSLLSARGPLRWGLQSISVAAVLGILWGVRALGSFDLFGATPIRANLGTTQASPQSLAICGPYRWVRHPLYSFIILMMWSTPYLTLDRLLLNALWTTWIVLGTILEERDLVVAFGDTYRDYQRRVPMLIPWPGGKGN